VCPYPKLEKKRCLAGFSLVELTIVVMLLAIMAAVVIPDSSPGKQRKLELAANQIAQALRFAQGEALRTGQHHGVTISQVTQRITVIKWDITTDPVSTELVPYHPVSKQSFEFDAAGLILSRGISISNASDIFLYDGIGRRRSLIFDPMGIPVWVRGSDGSVFRLTNGVVELSDGNSLIEVAVAPLTGRISIQ